MQRMHIFLQNIIKFIHSWDYYFKYSNNKDSILLLPSIKENINNQKSAFGLQIQTKFQY